MSSRIRRGSRSFAARSYLNDLRGRVIGQLRFRRMASTRTVWLSATRSAIPVCTKNLSSGESGDEVRLALQLPICFKVRALSDCLVSSAPE